MQSRPHAAPLSQQGVILSTAMCLSTRIKFCVTAPVAVVEGRPAWQEAADHCSCLAGVKAPKQAVEGWTQAVVETLRLEGAASRWEGTAGAPQRQ